MKKQHREALREIARHLEAIQSDTANSIVGIDFDIAGRCEVQLTRVEPPEGATGEVYRDQIHWTWDEGGVRFVTVQRIESDTP